MFTATDDTKILFEPFKPLPPKTLEEALSVIESLTAARDRAELSWAAAVAQSEELVKALEAALEENFKLNSRLYDFLPIKG